MADVSFIIDLAAKLTGGDEATSQLTAIAEKLGGVGNAAKTFDAALATARASLEGAAAASKTAASALTEGETKYKQLEIAADRAAKAVERAAAKGGVSPELAAKADQATAALKKEAAALDELRQKAGAAAAEQKRLETSVKNLEAASKKATSTEAAQAALARGSGKANEAAEAFGRFGGPIGIAGQKTLGLVEGLQKMTGALGPGLGLAVAGVAIVAALAAALVVLGVALGAAVVKTAAWGVQLADANRSAALTVEALSKSAPALSGIASILPDIQAKTGLASEELQGFAKDLNTAKVKAADMPAALKAVAIAEAALGKGAGAKLIEELKTGKKTAAELAKEMQSKFGDIVARKLLSLDSQTAKLKKNLAGTFGGLKIEGLLQALSTLVALFDQNTASGRFLKKTFETVFQPIIDGATKAIPVLKGFLLGIAIGALKAYIAFKPAIAALKEMFGGIDTKSLPSALEVAVFLGKALGTTLFLAAVALGVVAGTLLLPIALFQRLQQAGSAAWDQIKASVASVKSFIAGISLTDIGANMIQGLANGITNNASKVIAALGGVVTSAITTAKSKLGIASPSKVFEKLGGFTAEGFAGGIDSGAGDAQSAMSDMVAPPAAGAGAAGGSSLDLSGATFNFYGVKDAENAEGAFRRTLLSVINGTITELGGAEPEGAT